MARRLNLGIRGKSATTVPVRSTYCEQGARRSYCRPIAGRCRGDASELAYGSPRTPVPRISALALDVVVLMWLNKRPTFQPDR
jgi:hypothetical protein